MSYTSKDFINCRFNPLCEGRMIEDYPQLSVLDCADDKVIRYIVMIYSKDSPLIRGEQNTNHRKGIAATLAGFDENDEETLLPIYDCSDEYFLGRALLYIKTFEANRLWSKIVTNEQLYEEYTRRLMQPVKSDAKEKDEMSAIQTKAKLREELNQIDNDLEAFYQKLYEVDDQLEKAVKKKGVSPQNLGNV